MEPAEHPSSVEEPPTPDLPKVRGSVELDASARQQRVGTVNYEEMLEPAERKASIGAFAYGGKSDVAAAGAAGPANSLMSALNVEQQQQFWSSVRMKPLTLSPISIADSYVPKLFIIFDKRSGWKGISAWNTKLDIPYSWK